VGERHRRFPAVWAEGPAVIVADKFIEQNGHWRFFHGSLGMARIFSASRAKGKVMKQHFTMFAAYNSWANQRVYKAALSP
jgi:hypothetical protein